MEWQPAREEDLAGIHRLLKERRFPFLPDDDLSVQRVLSGCYSLVLKDGDAVVGWVAFSHSVGNDLSADIAVARSLSGKWATRGVIQRMADFAFNQLKADGILVTCYVPESLKFANGVGFRLVDGPCVGPDGGVTLRLSRQDAEGKWI